VSGSRGSYSLSNDAFFKASMNLRVILISSIAGITGGVSSSSGSSGGGRSGSAGSSGGGRSGSSGGRLGSSGTSGGGRSGSSGSSAGGRSIVLWATLFWGVSVLAVMVSDNLLCAS